MTILPRNKFMPEAVCCSNNNSKKPNSPFLFIWESELEQMCGQANDYGNIETGGECYGLFTHGRRPVIMLATHSGPDAIHQRARFRQDIAFLKRTNLYLVEEFGLNFLGTHHSHHKLKIKGPSSGDIRSAHAISTKNGYRRMCQIVLTFAEHANLVPPEDSVKNAHNTFSRHQNMNVIKSGWLFRFFKKRLFRFFNRRMNDDSCCENQSAIKVKIHPFLYNNAKDGLPFQCSLKLIPGLSPIRKSINYDTKIPELRHQYKFPRWNMIYDSIELRNNRIENENYLPTKITDAINTLPENILGKMKLSKISDLLFISLPLRDDNKNLAVAYETTPPYLVKMIAILADGKHTDVTNQVFFGNEQISLMTLYQRCERFIRLSSENSEKSDLHERHQ